MCFVFDVTSRSLTPCGHRSVNAPPRSPAILPPVSLRSHSSSRNLTGQAGQIAIIQMSWASGALNPRMGRFAPRGRAPEVGARSSDNSSANTIRLQGHQLAESRQYTSVSRDVGANETGDYNLSLTILP